MKISKHPSITSFCIFALFICTNGIAQKGIHFDFPNEGVLIDNIPVHGNDFDIKYTDNSLIRIKDCIIDINKDKGKTEGLNNYVLLNGDQIGTCCIKEVDVRNGEKNGVKIKSLLRRKVKKHMCKDTIHHYECSRIQKTVFIPANALEPYDAKDFYLYLGGHPVKKRIEEYDAISEIFDTTNDIVTVNIDAGLKALRIENRSEKTQHFVVYMVSVGFRRIKRLGHVEISKNGNEVLSLAYEERTKGATFYVFYCECYDSEWDCLKHNEKIGCLRFKP